MIARSQESVLPDGDEMATIHDSFGITFGLRRKASKRSSHAVV